MDDNGYTGRRYGCRHCAKSTHGTFYKITDGPHAGVKSKWIMTCHKTSWFGLQDPLPICADLIRWVYLADALGIDDSQLAPTVSWAFECYQRGLITKTDTGGKKLIWTRDKGHNNEIYFEVVEAIAHRRGKLGELLADGAFEAATKLGNRVDADGNTPEYYISGTKKNCVCKDQGGRNRPKWDMGNYLSIRGGKHADGSFGPGPDASTMTAAEYADMKNGSIYEETGRFLSFNDWLKEVYDSVGLCWTQKNYSVDPNNDEIATALNYTIGSNFTGDSLVYKMGRKLYNIAKALNTLRKGYAREHDTPRARRLEPLPPHNIPGLTPNDPAYVDIVQWNEQLDQFYDFQGWDRDTSWQKKTTLVNLGLTEIARALKREGKLK